MGMGVQFTRTFCGLKPTYTAQVGVPLKVVIWTANSLPPKPCYQRKLCVFLCVNAKLLQSYCSPPGSSVYGFSKQEYWSRMPCPPPGDLPNPGIEAVSLMSPALAGGFFTTCTTWENLDWTVCKIRITNLEIPGDSQSYFCFYFRHLFI